MTKRLIQFQDCRLLRNHQLVTEDLWVRDGKIIDPEKIFFDEKKAADLQIKCNGAIIAPGFIELQINGGFGVDFSHDINTVQDGIAKVAKGLLAHGVTSFCPTIVTSPQKVYHKIIPLIKKKPGGAHGATILGIHVEGPFINPAKKGAHPEDCIKTLDKGFESVLDMYGHLEDIKIVTLAPELANTSQVIREFKKRNIIVSVGHSMANITDGELAVNNGATLITHLFNAMLPFHHRDPGLVGLLASECIPKNCTVYFGIIADGIHTHPAALRIAYRTHPDGLVLVTDAISALGLEEGIHHIGQLDFEVKNGHAYIAGTTTLCGSIASMIQCVQIFKKSTNCSTVFALEAATLHPAQVIGIQKEKGTLQFGADADFIMLDDDLNLLSTWIAGDCVYTNENTPKALKKGD